MNNKKPIILVGGGGHCISCIDVIEQTGLYEIVGILDTPEKKGSKILNYTIIGSDDDIPALAKKYINFHITIGQIKSSKIRRSVYSKIKKAGGNLPVIISPLAYKSEYTNIEEGTIVMHHALINAGSSVGKCCIINSKALLEHEVKIDDFCHISTSSIANGQVHIGDDCFIGSNTVIANNINLVGNTIVSSGTNVMKSIDKPGTYIGTPLRKVR